MIQGFLGHDAQHRPVPIAIVETNEPRANPPSRLDRMQDRPRNPLDQVFASQGRPTMRYTPSDVHVARCCCPMTHCLRAVRPIPANDVVQTHAVTSITRRMPAMFTLSTLRPQVYDVNMRA